MNELKNYDEAYEELAVKIGEDEGIFEKADIIAFATKLYNNDDIVPKSMKADGGRYHGVDPVIAINDYWPSYVLSKENAGNDDDKKSPTQTQDKKPATTSTKGKTRYEDYKAPAADKAVVAGIQKKLASEYPERLKRQRNTKILKYVFDKPNIRDWDAQVLGKNPVAMPAVDATQLEKYRKMLVQTDKESVENFKILEDAINNKKPLPVYLPTKVVPKVHGAVLQTPGADQTTPVPVTKNGKDMRNFLLDEVVGKIPNENCTLGCTLFVPRVKVDENESFEAKSKSKKKSIGVKYVGVEEAYKKEDLHTFIYDYDRDDKNKIKTEEGKVKLDLTFKCLYEARDSSGKPTERTVRVSGTFKIPVWKIKEDMLQFRPTKVAGKILDDFDENDAIGSTADIANMLQGIFKGDLGDTNKDYSPKMRESIAAFQEIEDAKVAAVKAEAKQHEEAEE